MYQNFNPFEEVIATPDRHKEDQDGHADSKPGKLWLVGMLMAMEHVVT